MHQTRQQDYTTHWLQPNYLNVIYLVDKLGLTESMRLLALIIFSFKDNDILEKLLLLLLLLWKVSKITRIKSGELSLSCRPPLDRYWYVLHCKKDKVGNGVEPDPPPISSLGIPQLLFWYFLKPSFMDIFYLLILST